MATSQDAEAALGPVRDALFKACRKAHDLAEATETLESVYSKHKGQINPGYFYVPSSLDTGREVDDLAGEEKRLPHRERAPRAEAIEAVLSLRAAIDHAIQLVAGVSNWMDSQYEAADRRWTTRSVEELRQLRGAILQGHTHDAFLSALPMIRAGVPKALRKAARAVAKRMEEVKSAILLGVHPQSPNSAMSPELLARLEAAEAKIAAVTDGVDRSEVAMRTVPEKIALTKDHESMMGVLRASSAKCKTVLAVASAGPIRNRETVGRLLRELAALGLVNRPYGMRKGYALTEAGRKWMPDAT
jgi:hypothetical protein